MTVGVHPPHDTSGVGTIMSRRVAITMIVVGAAVLSVAFGLARMHRGNEYTMYWFGLGGVLIVIGVGEIRRR